MKTIKVLFFTFFLSIIIIISYMLSLDVQEWWRGAGLWFNLLERLAKGYFASFVLILIIQIKPYLNRRKIRKIYLNRYLFRIYFDLYQLFSLLLQGKGINILQNHNHPEIDFNLFDNKKEFEYPDKNMISIYTGSHPMIFQDFLPEQAFKLIVESILNNINRVEGYIDYTFDGNKKFAYILSGIRDSDLFESIHISTNKLVLCKMLNAGIGEIKVLYNLYLDLIKYMGDKGYSFDQNPFSQK